MKSHLRCDGGGIGSQKRRVAMGYILYVNDDRTVIPSGLTILHENEQQCSRILRARTCMVVIVLRCDVERNTL